VETMVWSGI